MHEEIESIETDRTNTMASYVEVGLLVPVIVVVCCQDILQLPHVAVVNPQINSILSTYLETFEVIHSSPPIETQEKLCWKGTVWVAGDDVYGHMMAFVYV